LSDFCEEGISVAQVQRVIAAPVWRGWDARNAGRRRGV
jgi:hypothetical protein